MRIIRTLLNPLFIVWPSTCWRLLLSLVALFNLNIICADEDKQGVLLQPQLHLSHYAIEDGLSLNSVTSFVKAQNGFVWIGTEDGLNRFDGYAFEVFKRSSSGRDTLPDNMITALLSDSQGRLWVGTDKGLAIWRGGQTFSSINVEGIKAGTVSHIIEDIYNRIWVVFQRQLLIFNEQTQTLEPYHEVLSVKTHQLNNSIDSIHGVGPIIYFGKKNCLNSIDIANLQLKEKCFDQETTGIEIQRIGSIHSNGKDILWLGTAQGAIRYNTLSESVELFNENGAENRRLVDNRIQSILVDKQSKTWLATSNGLAVYDPTSDKLNHYTKNYIDKRGLLSDDIVALYQDDHGLIWIGTYDSGFHVYNYRSQSFNHYFTKFDAFNLDSTNTIHSLTTDLLGNIWIGSYGSGVFQIDSQRKSLTQVNAQSGILQDVFVTALHFDIYDNLWISTLSGLFVYDPDYDIAVRIEHEKFAGIVSMISEDRNGDLWIGVDSGLVKIEGIKGKYSDIDNIQIIDFSKRLSDQITSKRFFINDIYEDVEGFLWVGTDLGLVVIEPNNDIQFKFVHDENNLKSLSHNYVQVIYEDTQGAIWIGTGDGLNRLVLNNSVNSNAYFERFDESDGLINDSVYGIQSGEGDDLWLSTSNGIFKFSTADNKFTRFSARDGLQSNEFNLWAYHKSSEGEIFFGGINGITSFFPDSVREQVQEYVPAVSLVRVNNQVIETRAQDDEIHLTKESDLLSIIITPLNFANPSSHEFRYRLKGLNDEWNDIGTSRVINISGLVGDGFELEVQTRIFGKRWSSETRTIPIVVDTNFWQSDKSLFVYFAIGLILALIGFVAWSRRLIVKSRIVRNELATNREYIRSLQLDIEREKASTDLANQELVQIRERIAYYESRFDEYAKKDKVSRFYKRKFFEEIINSEDAFYKTNQLDFPVGCLITISIANFDDLMKREHKANIEAAVAEFSDVVRDYVSGDDLICRWNNESFLMLESGTVNDIKQRLYNFYRLISNRGYDSGNGRLLQFKFCLTVIPVPITTHRSSLINRSVIAYLSVDLFAYLKQEKEYGAVVFLCNSQLHPAEIEKKISFGAERLVSEGFFELVALSEYIIKEGV